LLCRSDVIPAPDVIRHKIGSHADELVNTAQQPFGLTIKLCGKHDEYLLSREDVEVTAQDAPVFADRDVSVVAFLRSAAGVSECPRLQEFGNGLVKRTVVRSPHRVHPVSRASAVNGVAENRDQPRVRQSLTYSQRDCAFVVMLLVRRWWRLV